MSSDYTGLALVVTAVMGPLVAVFTLYFNNRTVKKVAAVTDATHEIVLAVDAAVNGKLPGSATISEEVTTILENQDVNSPTPSPTPAPENGRLALVPMIRYLTETVEELKASLESKQTGD